MPLHRSHRVSFPEYLGLAVDNLRAQPTRTGLAIASIAVAVLVVIVVVTLIGGIRTSLVRSLQSSGSDSFVVMRFDPDQVQMMASWATLYDGNPPLTFEESRRLQMPTRVALSAEVMSTTGTLQQGRTRMSGNYIYGKTADWPQTQNGTFIAGRNFVRAEVDNVAPVVVLSEGLARQFGPPETILHSVVRINGARFQVIGIFRSFFAFANTSTDDEAWVPITSALDRLHISENRLRIRVAPLPGVPQDQAINAVTTRLRSMRGLAAEQANNFVIKTNAALVEMSTRWLDLFLLIAVVLASIGLFVGGIGVIAIMMISVTERTREIGTRLAVGARRRDILTQFLTESVLVTLLGCTAGLTAGSSIAFLLQWSLHLPAYLPTWAIVLALTAAAIYGIVFGFYPAYRAAHLNPVDALRYE